MVLRSETEWHSSRGSRWPVASLGRVYLCDALNSRRY